MCTVSTIVAIFRAKKSSLKLFVEKIVFGCLLAKTLQTDRRQLVFELPVLPSDNIMETCAQTAFRFPVFPVPSMITS
jgi:hypothetical protein